MKPAFVLICSCGTRLRLHGLGLVVCSCGLELCISKIERARLDRSSIDRLMNSQDLALPYQTE